MKTYIVTGLKITLLTLILFGVIYPLMITGIAKMIGPNGGEGSKIVSNGRIVGFNAIGQSFKSSGYFHGRPSAVNYNAAATGGSNKGSNNPDYLDEVKQRIELFLKDNPDVDKKDVPIDIITASGGGLDPHISPGGALVQVARIAKVRGLSPDELKKLIDKHTRKPLLNLFGTSVVNVLELNLALDALK